MKKNRPKKKKKKIRRNNKCLFHNIMLECNSQGKKLTEKNHAIAKSGFLKK